jgi:hypothetical protein
MNIKTKLKIPSLVILTLICTSNFSTAISTASAQALPPPTGDQIPQSCIVREDQSSICKGDRVLDYRDHTGFIEELYSNATAIVEFDDGTRNVLDVQYLAREVSELYGFRIGDAVMDDEGYIGNITDLFENAQTEVTYPNGQIYIISLNDLKRVDQAPIVITRPWRVRSYPDYSITYSYGYVVISSGYIYPCAWPNAYPYGYPVFGPRVIYGIHPPMPRYGMGAWGHVTYPYRSGMGYPVRRSNMQRPLPYPVHRYPNGGIQGGYYGQPNRRYQPPVIRGAGNRPSTSPGSMNGGVIRGNGQPRSTNPSTGPVPSRSRSSSPSTSPSPSRSRSSSPSTSPSRSRSSSPSTSPSRSRSSSPSTSPSRSRSSSPSSSPSRSRSSSPSRSRGPR